MSCKSTNIPCKFLLHCLYPCRSLVWSALPFHISSLSHCKAFPKGQAGLGIAWYFCGCFQCNPAMLLYHYVPTWVSWDHEHLEGMKAEIILLPPGAGALLVSQCWFRDMRSPKWSASSLNFQVSGIMLCLLVDVFLPLETCRPAKHKMVRTGKKKFLLVDH